MPIEDPGDVVVTSAYTAEPSDFEWYDDSPVPEYGDIRDELVQMPENPWGGYGGSYVIADLFPIRHQLLKERAAHARTIFEFGSLYGHCLATMLDACQEASWCGWVDNEQHSIGSNAGCERNLQGYLKRHDRVVELWHGTRARDCIGFQADVVSVDAAHSYDACAADITFALTLKPILIFVDDYEAIADVKKATDDMVAYHGLQFEYHPTVNGLAVLTP